MFHKFLGFTLVFICTAFVSFAQLVRVSGHLTDDKGYPIEVATIAVEGTSIGTTSGDKGYYFLDVPAGKEITIVFSLVGYELQRKNITPAEGNDITLDVKLKRKTGTLKEVVKKSSREDEAGFIKIDAKKAGVLVSPIGGIEALIKTMVGTNNELTSQYNVRGGNYDENLVYVNDFEIYRPFLTRSGQQEGLSFINADLVSNVNFSVGGFQPKYGDKLSSVLDVDYKRPKEFGGRVMASALGAGVSLWGASKNEKFTYLLSGRQKSNQYLLQSQPTKGVYNPSFTDVQALLNYRFSDKWEMEVIANYARNRFSFVPEEFTSSFGLINKAYTLNVAYKGSEIDQFDSRFGGWSTTFKPNDRLRLKLLASGFQTNEKETYDLYGEYLLGELETDLGKTEFGQVKYAIGTGIIHGYARNYLKVDVGNLAHRGSYDGGKHYIQWGADANITHIADKLYEWERRDSAGFTLPYHPYSLDMTKLYISSATFDYMRYSGFVQDNFRFNDSLGLTVSVGARFNYSTLNDELLISPRAQISYKPLR